MRWPAALRLSHRKVGGLRFIRLGRIVLTICVARHAEPIRKRI